MRHNFYDPCLGPQSILFPFLEALSYEVFAVIGHENIITIEIGKHWFLIHYDFSLFFLIIIFCDKRRKSNNQFISKYSESPPIQRESMPIFSFFVYHFRWHVVSGPTKRIRSASVWQVLCQSKIRKLNITIIVHQNVLRLQVTVNNVMLVQVA